MNHPTKEIPEEILLSVVLPCLNESANLQNTLDSLKTCLDEWDPGAWEIIVADNGSNDGSQEIALKAGARCVSVSPRGYGAALRGGIQAAKGEWVVFLDADHTYRTEDLPTLVSETWKQKAEMGIANRFGKPLPAGAMPWLHRYLGTPVLSWLIRFFFGRATSDCNSGFRCLKRASFLKWETKSTGMEFASELLIKALKNGAKIIEIPSGLNPSPNQREPNLSTWRDGMNHLLTILFHAPGFFERTGVIITALALLGQLLCVIVGPVSIGPVEILDIHSQILFFGMGFVGIQFYALGLHIQSLAPQDKSLRMSRWCLRLESAEMLALLLVLGTITFSGVLSTIIFWASRGFNDIQFSGLLLFFFQLVLLPGVLGVILLSARLLSHSLRTPEPLKVGTYRK